MFSMENRMIRLVEISVLIHCGLVFLSVTASGVSVSLELTTSGCQHNCVIYDKGKECPSSVKVNGKEYSNQEDGFNIVIIDNYSGKVKTDYFRWFSRLSPIRWKIFRDFFMQINSSSTVVVVFQNMCTFFDKNWYKYLRDASNITISHPGFHRYNTAILVGCKGHCPTVTKGAIPFNYYGVSDRYRRVINFSLITDDKVEKVIKKEKKKEKKHGNVGSVLGGIIAVLFIICIGIILYVSFKRRPENANWKHYFVCFKKKNESTDESRVMLDGKCSIAEVKVSSNGTAEQPEYAPLTLSKVAQSNEHIYEYINPDKLNINTNSKSSGNKPREAENEYYSPSHVAKNDVIYQPISSQGISAICALSTDNDPPEVFDPRQIKNRRSTMKKNSDASVTKGDINRLQESCNSDSRTDSLSNFNSDDYRRSRDRRSSLKKGSDALMTKGDIDQLQESLIRDGGESRYDKPSNFNVDYKRPRGSSRRSSLKKGSDHHLMSLRNDDGSRYGSSHSFSSEHSQPDSRRSSIKGKSDATTTNADIKHLQETFNTDNSSDTVDCLKNEKFLTVPQWTLND